MVEDFIHPVDIEQFRAFAHEMVDRICDYYKSIEHCPVRDPKLQPGFLSGQLPGQAPEEPEAWQAIVSDVTKTILPGVLHWQSPNFFAYFPANASFPAMLADMWSGALNMIGFSWASSPIGTELEMLMMNWLAQLVDLPPKFHFAPDSPGGGVIQGTASEALLVALLGARTASLSGRPPEDVARLVAYSSDQVHSCFKKACMIAGITHCRQLPTRAEDEWAMRPEVLEAAIREDMEAGLLPCFLTATIGSTSSCAVDPIEELAPVASKANIWVHVDAAYAGSAALCPELRHHFRGLEAVDSYAFNPHKWMLVSFDCCALWVADTSRLRAALSLTPVFLRGTGNELDLKDLQIPLGRRFRSLKLYFVLRMYGAAALREYIRHHVNLATHFAELVRTDPRFELAAPPRFALVCFRLRDASIAANTRLLQRINESGRVFLSGTELAGKTVIRCAIGSRDCQLRHVEALWTGVCAAATDVLMEAL